MNLHDPEKVAIPSHKLASYYFGPHMHDPKTLNNSTKIARKNNYINSKTFNR